MKQIDQEPGAYRIQREDGSWTQRVDRKFCAGMAIVGIALLTWLGVAYIHDGGTAVTVVGFSGIGFLIGGLVTLSLRSIDW